MSDTEVKFSSFKDKPIFEVWSTKAPTDPKREPRPIVSFGLWKATAILNHWEELKKFVLDHKEA